jgi:cobalt-zinc-cadmium efflux system membrane fusion protein
MLIGCTRGAAQAETGALQPPIDEEDDAWVVRLDHPERFPLAAARERRATPELSVTGAVTPDVSRAIPVVSLASGRVVELRVRLGDQVRKGQLLLRIQSADVASAVGDYRKAVADEALTRTQLERAQALFDRGAMARKDLEIAQDGYQKAVVDRQTIAERLHAVGASTEQPATGIIDVTAPAGGIITEQNVAAAAGVKSLDSSPNLFTISDLSHVWIVCDVYENNLSSIDVGDRADIHLAAYPDQVLTGRVSDIGPILDPNLRTAKVRIEVANAGLMRVGMFVLATLHGKIAKTRAVVPATAVLHLHDRDWVYVPAADGRFARREVVSGQTIGQDQELISGIRIGDRVVSNALALQNSVEQ